MKTDDMNEFEWFDLWCEQHSHLLEKKDYPQLVQCCRYRLDRDPEDAHAVEALAEAYLLNHQQQEAIDMLTPYYKRDPEHPLYAHAILDALLADGRFIVSHEAGFAEVSAIKTKRMRNQASQPIAAGAAQAER